MSSRTDYAGNITNDYLGQTVTVKGWVANLRNLGGLIFINLRDREGIVQIVIDSQKSGKKIVEIAESLHNEYVIEATGKVVRRSQANQEIKTGEIEIEAAEIIVLNASKPLPFDISDEVNPNYETRLKYRYLDLRRPSMIANLKLRHQVTKAIRSYFDANQFIDVETPFLGKSTPEGARDYLVPSRIHSGHFYALPQSPQIWKQLLMNSGIDRYYQIVKCFRDEDLRGDRQPEFTQIDVETTFLDEKEIQDLIEGMIAKIMKEVKGIEVSLPFPRMDYDEAMARFGSDKPDTRFGIELIDLSELLKNSDFKAFSDSLTDGGQVKALCVPQAAGKYSRADLDDLNKLVEQFGTKNLFWIKVTDTGLSGSVAKYFSGIEGSLIELTQAKAGDLLLFVADMPATVAAALGALRNRLAKELNLIDESKFNYLWIVNWPMFEWSDEEGRYMSAHHPFTLPYMKDLDKMRSGKLEEVHAHAYDIVLNGYEIGGGSLRISNMALQEEMFRTLGFTTEKAEEQFGFLIHSMDYGYPPEGGIAFGLDRLVMLLAGTDNIRDVIAFPKNARAFDPLSNAPSAVSEEQLRELSLEISRKETD